MKKVLFTVLLLILLLALSACADDRYDFCCATNDGNEYYIDKWTVKEVTKGDILRFWTKRVVSAKSRNIYIAEAKSKKEKKWLSQLVEFKECSEISIKNNTIRTIALYAYDSKGRVIYSFTDKYAELEPIIPDSVSEVLRNRAELINIINIMESTFPRY